MKCFREYATYEDTKKMVLDVLDPQRETIDADSTSVLSRPLSDFKHRADILNTPGLSDIINKSENRGAIVHALKNRNTTVGNLISLLAQGQYKEPEHLG